jgi:hypothetical protein
LFVDFVVIARWRLNILLVHVDHNEVLNCIDYAILPKNADNQQLLEFC